MTRAVDRMRGAQDRAAAVKRWLALFARDRVAAGCAGVGALFLLAALLAPILAPQNPYDLVQIELADALLPPFATAQTTETLYPLGTDALGRDVFSMALYGLRVSLIVATVSTLGALLFGTSVGLLAAYAGGWLEALIMRIVDIFLSLPAILLALLLIALLGRGLENTILALLLVQWTQYARVMHAAALGEINKNYVEAAKLLGLSQTRIVFHHILPNCLPPVFVILAVQFGYVISVEASLSFLGLGLPVTQPSLGSLVALGQEFLLSGAYWVSLIPGLILLLLIFTMNIIGDRLRALEAGHIGGPSSC